MANNGSAAPWPGDYVGRLWDHPLVELKPVRVCLRQLWEAAPRPLQKRARWAMTREQQALWELIRDPARLGTVAVAKVPLWIPEVGVGYVLDFFLPESGVNVQLDRWRPEYLDDEEPEIDFEAEPDNPHNESREEDLRTFRGIEVLHFWDTEVSEAGPEVVLEEIRFELGIGRPPTLRRDWYKAGSAGGAGDTPPGPSRGHLGSADPATDRVRP